MRQAYQIWGQPCTSSSGGPSPPMTACRRTSPASTYRLVNVSLKPAGRLGAPETEPGPSGTGELDDEPMTISFQRSEGLLVGAGHSVIAPSARRARRSLVGSLVCPFQ